jgi:hypothetical protein
LCPDGYNEGTMEIEPGPLVAIEDVCFSPSLVKIGAALAAAQGEIGNAPKDSANPFFKSKYADLASVLDTCRGPLSSHGIARWQGVVSRDKEIGVRTLLICEGEYLGNTVWCQLKEFSPQALGSVITYLRRYSLAAAVGIAQADDDAEAAQGRAGLPAEGVPGVATKLADQASAAKARIKSKPAPAPEPEPTDGPQAPIELGAPPANIPAGEAPIYVLRDRKWVHTGFAVALNEKQQARIKILQKELGIGDAEWRAKLGAYYGKGSSTDLTSAEASDCIERLERRKGVQAGV